MTAEPQFKSAGSLNDHDAQAIGAELCRHKLFDGAVPAPAVRRQIIELARDPKSPMHKHFTWDNSIAAARYRDLECQKMLRSIHIVWKDDSGQENSARAFHYVPIEKPKTVEHSGPGGQYERQIKMLREVLADRDDIDYVIYEALSWVKRFSRKHRHLRDLNQKTQTLFLAFEQVERALEAFEETPEREPVLA